MRRIVVECLFAAGATEIIRAFVILGPMLCLAWINQHPADRIFHFDGHYGE